MTGDRDDALLDCLAAGADDYVRSADGPDTLRGARPRPDPPQAVARREPPHPRGADAPRAGRGRANAPPGSSPRPAPRWSRSWSGATASWRRSAARSRTTCAARCRSSAASPRPCWTRTRNRCTRRRRPPHRAHPRGRRADGRPGRVAADPGPRQPRRPAPPAVRPDRDGLAGHRARSRPATRAARSTSRSHRGMTADADEGLVRVILENLINNAFKFTRKVEKPVIEVGWTGPGDDPRFYIRDNGAGFPAGKADRAVPAVRPAAQRRRLPRHRHRPDHRAPRGGTPRRRDLGRGRGRPRRDLLVHPPAGPPLTLGSLIRRSSPAAERGGPTPATCPDRAWSRPASQAAGVVRLRMPPLPPRAWPRSDPKGARCPTSGISGSPGRRPAQLQGSWGLATDFDPGFPVVVRAILADGPASWKLGHRPRPGPRFDRNHPRECGREGVWCYWTVMVPFGARVQVTARDVVVAAPVRQRARTPWPAAFGCQDSWQVWK